MSSTSENFFDEQLWQSRVKAEIVSKYFWAWAKNAVKGARRHRSRVIYLDLFAGPGRYKDGNRSTPLLVMDSILREPDFKAWVQPIYNDADATHINALRREFEQLPGVSEMEFQPQFHNQQVTTEIVSLFQPDMVPTFTFFDPHGYGGLSRELIAASTSQTLCDAIFFFNYPWINRHLSNPVLHTNTYPIFGRERSTTLADRLIGVKPGEREDIVVAEFKEALKEVGVEYPIFFKMRHRARNETAHYLVFASTHGLAQSIMKNVMEPYSTESDQGVPGMLFDPKTLEVQPHPEQLALGFFIDPIPPGAIDRLVDELRTEFSGRSLTMEKVFFEHHMGTPYVERHYKEALRQLEAMGHIDVEPPASARPKRKGIVTFADKCVVTFPSML